MWLWVSAVPSSLLLSSYYMDVPRFSYSPVEGHLGSFQSLMIVEGFHIGESTVKKKSLRVLSGEQISVEYTGHHGD